MGPYLGGMVVDTPVECSYKLLHKLGQVCQCTAVINFPPDHHFLHCFLLSELQRHLSVSQ